MFTVKLVNQAMHPLMVLLVLVLLVGQFLYLPLRPAQVLLGIVSALALSVHMSCSMQSLSASLAEKIKVCCAFSSDTVALETILSQSWAVEDISCARFILALAMSWMVHIWSVRFLLVSASSYVVRPLFWLAYCSMVLVCSRDFLLKLALWSDAMRLSVSTALLWLSS